MDKDVLQHLNELDSNGQKLAIEKALILNKALHSNDADTIYKAQRYIKTIESKGNDDVKPKSLLIDPQTLTLGYKEKNYHISYNVLRNMAKIPVIKAIIETRKEQVLSFCEPQRDKYSTGFIIQPKGMKDKTMSKAEQKRSEEITEIILNAGESGTEWHGDNFNSFTRKFIEDSLVLDQGCGEIVFNRAGNLVEFCAVDGATIRISETYNDDHGLHDDKLKNGYLPYYVQIFEGKILSEFYPWELIFAIRNPQSNIYSNGYGRSELEDLMSTVTSLLNSDLYNANYFKVGSNPKGILKISGNINQSRLEEFRNHWQAQMTGVNNAHKLPVIESDKMDFINTQSSNKDMEFSKYQEYLIKLACASYKIDPSEIGFPMSGSSDAKPMFEGNNEARLKYSRDKGLIPLIKFYQHYLNKYIIDRIDDGYELQFVGLDATTREQELESEIKAVSSFKTVNEARESMGMKKIENGDIILNPIFFQAQMNAQQMQQQQDQQMQQPQGQEENPFLKSLDESTEILFGA